MLLGLGVARATGVPAALRNHVLCAVSFGNVGNLPLVFVFTLCHDQHAMFYQTLGDRCEHLGVAYVAFNMAAGTVFQFTIAIRMLRTRPEPQPIEEEDAERDAAAVQQHRLLHKQLTVSDLLAEQRAALQPGELTGGKGEWGELLPSPGDAPGGPGRRGAPTLELQPLSALPALPPQQQQPPLLPFHPGRAWGLGSAAGSSHPGTSTIDSNSEAADPGGRDDDDTEALLTTSAAGWDPVLGTPPGTKQVGVGGSSSGIGSSSKRGGRLVRALAAAMSWLRAVDWAGSFPMPTQATFLGLIIGCIPAAKQLLYSPDPPLRVVSESLELLGGGLIPTAVPLLGAVLSRCAGAGAQVPACAEGCGRVLPTRSRVDGFSCVLGLRRGTCAGAALRCWVGSIRVGFQASSAC